MKKLGLALGLALLGCVNDPIEPEVVIKEIPTYKPTVVAVRFLSHNDEVQALRLDTVYLDNLEDKVIWKADSHTNLCIDAVQFELVLDEK